MNNDVENTSDRSLQKRGFEHFITGCGLNSQKYICISDGHDLWSIWYLIDIVRS